MRRAVVLACVVAAASAQTCAGEDCDGPSEACYAMRGAGVPNRCLSFVCVAPGDYRVELDGVYYQCPTASDAEAESFWRPSVTEEGVEVQCPGAFVSRLECNADVPTLPRWPSLHSVEPSVQLDAGGTVVSIFGSNLNTTTDADVAVVIGYTRCPTVTPVDDSLIIATTPELLPQTNAAVAVMLDGASALLRNVYTVELAPKKSETFWEAQWRYATQHVWVPIVFFLFFFCFSACIVYFCCMMKVPREMAVVDIDLDKEKVKRQGSMDSDTDDDDDDDFDDDDDGDDDDDDDIEAAAPSKRGSRVRFEDLPGRVSGKQSRKSSRLDFNMPPLPPPPPAATAVAKVKRVRRVVDATNEMGRKNSRSTSFALYE